MVTAPLVLILSCSLASWGCYDNFMEKTPLKMTGSQKFFDGALLWKVCEAMSFSVLNFPLPTLNWGPKCNHSKCNQTQIKIPFWRIPKWLENLFHPIQDPQFGDVQERCSHVIPQNFGQRRLLNGEQTYKTHYQLNQSCSWEQGLILTEKGKTGEILNPKFLVTGAQNF